MRWHDVGMALERVRAAVAYEDPRESPQWPDIIRLGIGLAVVAAAVCVAAVAAAG
jgi:hypothetical protein